MLRFFYALIKGGEDGSDTCETNKKRRHRSTTNESHMNQGLSPGLKTRTASLISPRVIASIVQPLTFDDDMTQPSMTFLGFYRVLTINLIILAIMDSTSEAYLVIEMVTRL